MTPQEWSTICSDVTDAMKNHTRSFVTPLSTSDDKQVRLVGSGSYVAIDEDRLLVTCEHVARTPIGFRFYDCDSVFRYPKAFTMEPHPIDAAFAPIKNQDWSKVAHQAATVSYERFAPRHNPTLRGELLFFRGYAGDNAHYGFGVHETNSTGYCTQEKVIEEPDSQIFELFWKPENTQKSAGTSQEDKAKVKFDNPAGFSGSLVWNTRYLEITNAGKVWTPEDAVVTGLLRRFDRKTKTLLVLRIEHLKAWLEKHL